MINRGLMAFFIALSPRFTKQSLELAVEKHHIEEVQLSWNLE